MKDRFCLSCGQSTPDTPCPYCGSGVFKTTTNNALLDIENLASRFHQVYEEELKRQGKKSKHSYFFHELPKDIADLDRALAKFVIEFVIPAVLKNYEKVKQSDNHLLDKITNRNEWQELLDKL